MKKHLVTALIALVFGFAGAGLWAVSGLGNGLTRDYLVANPDILPEMAEAYQRGQAQERLAGIEDQLATPFAGAVLGNPQGSKTLVKFTDYGCTFCRQSVAEVEKLIAADPELRVVIREWPIFEGSEKAARMGLAAAKQGKFEPYYHTMFKLGPPTDETIAQAAQAAKLDIEAARAFAASDEASVELAKNMSFAQTLQFTGTPSWVAGGQVIEGLVPYERLAEVLDIKG